MSNKLNLLAGYLNSFLGAFLGIVTTPLYIKYLGIESYGLISFFFTIQAIAGLLDMGVGSALNRESARLSAQKKLDSMADLLYTIEIFYWGIGVLIALSLFLLSPLISNNWLNKSNLPNEVILNSIILMGILAACQWPISLYQSILVGTNHITLYSMINISMRLISVIATVFIFEFIYKTIELFFIIQALVFVIYLLLIRYCAWGKIRANKNMTPHFNLNTIKSIWKFSLGMTSISLLSIILMNLDKIILSKFLTLEEFGWYSLAVTVAGTMSLFASPTFSLIYPRLSGFVAIECLDKVIELYRLGTRIFLSFYFSLAAFLIIFAENILTLWIGDTSTAIKVYPIMQILVFGAALNGVMIFPYALQLAHGNTMLTIKISLIKLLCILPIFFILIERFGAIGGASSIAILNFLYIIIGTTLTHKKFLLEMKYKWLLIDVISTALICLTSMGAVSYFTSHLHFDSPYNLIMAMPAIILPFILIYFSCGNVKKFLNNTFLLKGSL